jgi:Ca-activated chloride channel family protein
MEIMSAMRRRSGLWALIVGAVALGAAAEPVLWPEHQRAFFQDGPGLLLEAAARRGLLQMDVAARDAFMTRFLVDPLPETEENELSIGIERRARLARSLVATPLDDRARLLFLHGEPAQREKIDCGTTLVPIEIWSYGTDSPQLLLYQPPGRHTYRLWLPADGKRVLYSSLMEGWFEELGDFGQEQRRIDIQLCKAVARVDAATGTRGLFDEQGEAGLTKRLEARLGPPEDLARWSAEAAKTPLPEAPPTLPMEGLVIDFPFQAGQRIDTRFVATLAPGAELGLSTDEGSEATVEIEVEGLLEFEESVFEEFKVRFKRPPAAPDEAIALVWDRRLRPQRQFVARLAIRDVVSGATSELVRVVSVPSSVERVVAGGGSAPVEEVAAGALAGADSLVLVPPVTDGLSKAWRAEALVTGERIRRVVFAVDGDQQLIRTRPPYTADLRLASVPVEQVVTATGFDAEGEEVDEDRVILNKARALFRVDIVSPLDGVGGKEPLAVRAEVSVPDESRLEAVEFSLNDTLLATFDRPPFELEVDVDPEAEVSYVTVVARLDDGRRAEDVLFLNAPRNLARLEVGLVELFATVTDGSGRLIEDLESEDFRILEGGNERPIERFDRVENLPLVVGFALDTSTSMADHMAEAREAAIGFLKSVLKPDDRAFAVAFNNRPELVAPPTDDVGAVERALADVHSEGWTTLYDAVVRSLFYFRGFGGRRALVVLSDGEDTASRSSFGETLEYAKQSGTVIYAIGLGKGAGVGLRGKLKQLANDTGGRYFHAAEATDLRGVYEQIERELRSQYFLTFAPAAAGEVDLEEVEVQVKERSLNVRATRGYAP